MRCGSLQQLKFFSLFPKVEVGAFSHVMDFKSQLQEVIQRDGVGQLE